MGIVHPIGVQANKLHFCDLELILNITGYSHIKENNNKISFFNMGTVWKKFDPSSFFQFSLEHPQENKGFLKASIFDVLMVESLLGVDPTQSYGENTKSPIQDFIDFAMKPHWKLIFFTNSSQVAICYFYILLFDSLISLWFWSETAKNKFRKKNQSLMGFYSRIYEILDGAFSIFPITLGRVDPLQWFDHQNITNWRL